MAWRIAAVLNALTILVMAILFGLAGADLGSIGTATLILGSPFLALLLMALGFCRWSDASMVILMGTVFLLAASFPFVPSIFPPPIGRPVPAGSANCGPPAALVLLVGQWALVAVLLVGAIASRLGAGRGPGPATKPIPFDPD